MAHISTITLSLLIALWSPASYASASLPLLAAAQLLPDLVEKVMPGVVNISSTTVVSHEVYGMGDFMKFWGIPQAQKQTSLGSGFLIDNDGFILTNNHVVEQASEVIVTLKDKRSFKARIIGRDPKTDLALIRIRDKDGKVPSGLSAVPLGDSEAVRIAETVVAVGNPFGLQHTVTAGIISAKNRTIGVGPFDNFLQTDASINPGNSGGPLFNLKGEVIGINTVIFSRTGQSGGLGFAIPTNEAKEMLPMLKTLGRVPRPWIGIVGQRMNEGLQAYYDLPVSQGVLVTSLVSSGPADKNGLRQGDIIVSVDGSSVLEPVDIERLLAKRKPKDKVTLKLKRRSRTFEVQVVVDEMPPLERLPVEGIV